MRLNNSKIFNELHQFNYKDINLHAIDIDLKSILDSLESWSEYFCYDGNMYILDFYDTGSTYKINLETKEMTELSFKFNNDVIMNGYYDWFGSGNKCGKHFLMIECPDYDTSNLVTLTVVDEELVYMPINIISDKGYDANDVYPDYSFADANDDDIIYCSCTPDISNERKDFIYKIDIKKGTMESMNVDITESAENIPGEFKGGYFSNGKLQVMFRVDKYLIFYEYSETLNKFYEVDRIITTLIGYNFSSISDNHMFLNYKLDEFFGSLLYDIHTHEKYLTPRLKDLGSERIILSKDILIDNDTDNLYILEKKCNDNNKVSNDNDVVQVDVIDGVLQLTSDKYQKTNMINNTEIVFPSVNKFTEIHLYFAADSNINISLPDNCKWRVELNIEEGQSYEIIMTYNTIEWLVNVVTYS